MKILGMDEAGRGPAIGPMVVAGVMIEEGDEKDIEGVKDSKLLSHKLRVEFDEKIKNNTKYVILEVNPQEIDAALESHELNLNWLEAHKYADIINELKPDRAIIDCPSPNCEAFEEYVRNLLENKDVKLIVENKADLNHKTCSAASILAKVRREERMEEIKEKYGETGPGYSSNAVTQKFIKENWSKYPEIFRHTWATLKNAKKASAQNKLNDFDN
jgi:ribonuclease HII